MTNSKLTGPPDPARAVTCLTIPGPLFQLFPFSSATSASSATNKLRQKLASAKDDTTTETAPGEDAAHAVFNTYELIETIALALPTEDILLANVNTVCLSVVTRSKPVSNRLAYGPDTSGCYRRQRQRHDCVITSEAIHAKVLILRVKETEVIAVQNEIELGGFPCPFAPWPRLDFVDGTRTTLVFGMDHKRIWVRFENKDNGEHWTWDVQEGSFLDSVPAYLDRFHGIKHFNKDKEWTS